MRRALPSRGIQLQRLVAVGYGQVDPIASNATAAGRARNPRIEFRVVLERH